MNRTNSWCERQRILTGRTELGIANRVRLSVGHQIFVADVEHPAAVLDIRVVSWSTARALEVCPDGRSEGILRVSDHRSLHNDHIGGRRSAVVSFGTRIKVRTLMEIVPSEVVGTDAFVDLLNGKKALCS